MKNLITGGAGFIGTNLIERLINMDQEVICIDNLETGNFSNLSKWSNKSNFKFIKHNVQIPIDIEVDRIWHLACPASPKKYQLDPINTSKTIFLGTYNMLQIAKKYNARILNASSSEIYGDPKVHPQPESYINQNNEANLRGCYSLGKEFCESLCLDFHRINNVQVRIARIFNTYGPFMCENDGRVISNFISKSLKNETLKIYGDGNQTRSFCFIDDMIEGLFELMNSNYNLPLNLGSTEEISINDLKNMIIKKTASKSKVLNIESLPNDPLKRKPDIEKARKLLNWNPVTSLESGIEKTITYFKYNYEESSK